MSVDSYPYTVYDTHLSIYLSTTFFFSRILFLLPRFLFFPEKALTVCTQVVLVCVTQVITGLLCLTRSKGLVRVKVNRSEK